MSSSSGSPSSCPAKRECHVAAKDDEEDIYAHARLPAFEGKHFITYDRSSVHKLQQQQQQQQQHATTSSSHSLSPTTPASASARSSGITTRALPEYEQPQTRAQIRAQAQSQTRARRRTSRDVYADLPPLQQEEEDDEDSEDERTFSRYQRESNSWLLFFGVFALITTLSITTFTVTPSQAHNRQAMQLLLAHVKEISVQMENMPPGDPDALNNVLRDYNFSSPLPIPTQAPSTLVSQIRDELVPSLWYSSLIFTLAGTMLTLCIKHWLMSCTYYPSFFDPDPPEALRDAERLELRRPSAARKAELRKSRKDTLTRTENTQWAVPWLMYCAVSMFVIGVVAKFGSCLWLLYFPPM